MSQTESRTYRVETLLDVMSVPALGDPLAAVVAVDHAAPVRDVECDVLVVGGGLGGVAAAWAAAHAGAGSASWRRPTGSAVRSHPRV
jgi:hypothetical protein